MSIEQRFDVPFVAAMALREKQIQQHYRPVIGVHKWFARRPGSLFRSLLLAEFGNSRLRDSYFRANNLSGVRVGDPFMGGGTPIIEANRLGCDVLGLDINPMASWIVRQEIESLDVEAYQDAARAVIEDVAKQIGRWYVTDCPTYGDKDVPVKCFLWVKVIDCNVCGDAMDLFPSYLIAENKRHPRNVLVCPGCGELNEVDDRAAAGLCQPCGEALLVAGPAKRGACRCRKCGSVTTYPKGPNGAVAARRRLFALEYYNPRRKRQHRGRFFKKTDRADLQRVAEAERQWAPLVPRFVPDEDIPRGDETQRLHRWGYTQWRDLFNPRQLVGLELSCRRITQVEDARLRNALATNLSDMLRYQNTLCRYHAGALKCLDVFAVHGFPVGLIECEANLLGNHDETGAAVGSGGWTNVVAKFVKAKRFCETPFEFIRDGPNNVRVTLAGESIGHTHNGQSKMVEIECASATSTDLGLHSLDAVFTDPPYFGNVQYAELMDFCHVWLRRLVAPKALDFDEPTTRSADELTGNTSQGRGIVRFTEGLSMAWSHAARALKRGAPLAFTYHHNELTAYQAIGVSLLDAGLTCSASLPCPAEMSGSIHIHGTRSSIVDTVFVCRTQGATRRRWLCESADDLLEVVMTDLCFLAEAGREPTVGDTRCVLFGHLVRLGVWRLRSEWHPKLATQRKLDLFAEAMARFGEPEQLAKRASAGAKQHARFANTPVPLFAAGTAETATPEVLDAVSF